MGLMYCVFFTAMEAARYQIAAAIAPGSGTNARISAETYDDRPACNTLVSHAIMRWAQEYL